MWWRRCRDRSKGHLLIASVPRSDINPFRAQAHPLQNTQGVREISLGNFHRVAAPLPRNALGGAENAGGDARPLQRRSGALGIG